MTNGLLHDTVAALSITAVTMVYVLLKAEGRQWEEGKEARRKTEAKMSSPLQRWHSAPFQQAWGLQGHIWFLPNTEGHHMGSQYKQNQAKQAPHGER